MSLPCPRRTTCLLFATTTLGARPRLVVGGSLRFDVSRRRCARRTYVSTFRGGVAGGAGLRSSPSGPLPRRFVARAGPPRRVGEAPTRERARACPDQGVGTHTQIFEEY